MQDYQPRMLSTYALTLFRHNAEINGEPVKVDFWDTAGQERFNSMHPAYYHQAHACILCFDVTRKATYKNLPAWLKELREYRTKIPTICIANKVDVDTKVMTKDFAFPKKHGMPLYFCSAADGTNVVAAFEDAISAGHSYANSDQEDLSTRCWRWSTTQRACAWGAMRRARIRSMRGSCSERLDGVLLRADTAEASGRSWKRRMQQGELAREA